MFIQQIEIDNFKSFVGKTTIPFKKGFTTVSGPNGSGKSNIVDSVLFCLGLSSSRTMRAEKLTDLINNQSAKRREASVEITFNKGGTELPDAILQAALSEDDTQRQQSLALLETLEAAETVKVARKIKETPSGTTSTYYLNGKPSTLTEIHEFLALFNVSPGCYNVMMQGDVASIVNMSAVERRKIIDELAGVADFDRKIEAALREMTTTTDTIDRNHILLGEIQLRLEQLGGEREKALAYQALKDEQIKLASSIEIVKLKGLMAQLDANQRNLDRAKTQRITAKETFTKLGEGIQATTVELKQVNDTIKKQGEDKLLALTQQMEALKAQVGRRQDGIVGLHQRQEETRTELERLDQDFLKLADWMANNQSEIDLLKQQESELKLLVAGERKAMEQHQTALNLLESADSQAHMQRQELRQKLEHAQDTLAKLQREQLALDARQIQASQANAVHLQQLSSLQYKQEQLQSRYTSLSSEFETLEEQKNTLEGVCQQLANDKQRLQTALQRTQEQCYKTKQTVATVEAKRLAYEEMSFSRPVEAILGLGLQGVHGTVAQLATVDAEYQLALEMALGGRIQNIVVDDDQVAQTGIRHLQNNRLGRATFLPLNKIKVMSTPKGASPTVAGVVDYAINLVEFDNTYATVFKFALGDTLVVESVEAARPLLNQYRMVTLDGSILEKTGAMTGGATQQHRAGNRSVFGGGSSSAGSQQDVELSNLRAELAQLDADKLRIEQHLGRIELEWQKQSAQLATVTHQHQRYLAQLEVLEKQLNEQTQELNTAKHQPTETALTTDAKALQAQLATLAKQEQNAQAEITTLQDQVTLLEGQTSSTHYQELVALLQEAKFQFETYEADYRHVQNTLKQKETELDIRQSNLQEKQLAYETKTANIGIWDKEIALFYGEIEGIQQQLTGLSEELAGMDDEIKAFQAERERLQSLLIDQEKQKHTAERSVQEAEQQLIAIQAQLRELEPQITQLQAQLLALFPDLSERLADVSFPTQEALNSQITKLQQKMTALEPVNMLAISEFEQVSLRQEELATKLTTLETEKDALANKVHSYEALKRQYFMKAFDSVNTQFKEIYAELSDGHGQLILTNPTDPLAGGLTIEASPRGKKTQRIEAMSGGEKSLTSLAFVFSLQRTMPAPFYALDEVDQNLDGLNVEKLAKMVQRESQTAQFVVVSLRKPMIDNSDRTVGVTQKRNGVSKVTGIQLREDRLETEGHHPVAMSLPMPPVSMPNKPTTVVDTPIISTIIAG
jgi:chromosome segregation protein